MFIRSAEPVLLGNMYLIMLFKGIVSYTGVLSEMPAFFGQFPIPLSLGDILSDSTFGDEIQNYITFENGKIAEKITLYAGGQKLGEMSVGPNLVTI